MSLLKLPLLVDLQQKVCELDLPVITFTTIIILKMLQISV
jgi:hypothetical protein